MDLFVCVWKMSWGMLKLLANEIELIKLSREIWEVYMGNKRGKKEGGSEECKTMHEP